MRFKSNYNVGDIVKFYNKKTSKEDVGQIRQIFIRFSYDFGKEENYSIAPIKIEWDYCNYYDDSVAVALKFIRRKINKKAFRKAFEKEYAKQCVEQITHQHEDKGEQYERNR